MLGWDKACSERRISCYLTRVEHVLTGCSLCEFVGVSGFTSSVDVAASDENHPGYPLCLGYLQSVNRVLKNIRGAWWILSLAQEDNEKNLAHEQYLAPPGICFATLLIWCCHLLVPKKKQ